MESDLSENENQLTDTDKKSKALDAIDKDIVERWKLEQETLKKRLVTSDVEAWQINRAIYNKEDSPTSTSNLRYVAGMDISFLKNTNKACSGLFVFDLSDDNNLVYSDIDQHEMDQPYVRIEKIFSIYCT
jgi:hypothetical protein